jgi:hypothetical protein
VLAVVHLNSEVFWRADCDFRSRNVSELWLSKNSYAECFLCLSEIMKFIGFKNCQPSREHTQYNHNFYSQWIPMNPAEKFSIYQWFNSISWMALSNMTSDSSRFALLEISIWVDFYLDVFNDQFHSSYHDKRIPSPVHLNCWAKGVEDHSWSFFPRQTISER